MASRIRLAAALAALSLTSLASSGARASGPDRHHYQVYEELEGKPVRQVVVLGNNRTREVVFRREMRLQEDVTFRSEDLWRDWERITDLGIFAEVEVDAVPSGDGVLVVVSVHERPWWFAAPTVDYDLKEKEITVGFRTRLRNLGGMNQTFRSTVRVGARDLFSASWETPWVGTKRRTFVTGLDVELPQPDIDELRTARVHAASTRFLGDYKKTRQGLTLFGRLEILNRDGTHPAGGVEQLSPVVGLGWFRDKRNLRVDPSRGTFASMTGELVSGWTDDDLSYGRTYLDGRGFLSVGGGVVLASRAVSILTRGEVPDYRRLGVGGDDSIRGQPTGVMIGDNAARGSAEVRFPLLPRRRFALPIPFVPKRISNVDLRVDGEAFVDVGTAWNDSGSFRDSKLRRGVGFGLRIFLPIFEVARVEVAFDESGRARWYFSEGNMI